ncbi:MAG: N-acetyl-gamma-glutamyl-phosphate reductase [Actinomycetota bacterium]|nr:N-acetyl-gamma-glutamyl-phosphate reductase [Actinomycetota bacterium]
MLRIGIVGASGYTGSELMRLLINHPKVEVSYVTANRHIGTKVADLNKGLYGLIGLSFEEFDPRRVKDLTDFVFVALPHGKSMDVVPALLESGVKLIDLSGDFRFADKDIYESWYKMEHTAGSLLGKAAYGLSELNREMIKASSFVANPGCFPTGAILALAPALKADLIEASGIIIDALTGTSGAGRVASEELHFSEVSENVTSYKLGGIHQHIPEMEAELAKIAGVEVKVSFSPHLASFSRGIYSTIYADLKKKTSLEDVISVYDGFYAGEHFVKVLLKGHYPEVKSVSGSNFCQIGIAVDERLNRLIIISAIDNLIKGASGQAIQNMNLMLGLKEKDGLEMAGLRP